MSSSAVEQLHRLLVEDEEQRRIENDEHSKREATVAPLQRDIDKVWRAHGMISPITGFWKRNIPSNLYQCPLSAPPTTLVHWSSLPLGIRSKCKKPDDDDIVEVPLSYLVANNNEQASGTSSSLSNRALEGNLTTKLTEYTRGVVGQCRPFRPGGMDDDNHGDNHNKDEAKALVQEQERNDFIREALEVLKKGSQASWRDGTIQSAPPGASFQAGISWKDVDYQDHAAIAKGVDAVPIIPEHGLEQMNEHVIADTVDSEPLAAPVVNNRSTSAGIWEKSFLDDDSLFGDSSSSSSESEDEEDMSDTEDEHIATQDSQTNQEGEQNPKAISEVSTDLKALDIIATGVDDVDSLLAEFSLSDDGAFTNKKRMTQLSTNPLQLAQEQSLLAQQASRKSWADTKPLPIDDFNSYIPNPAMTFPFELDDFQQQAVARLERSESIFVAAHTSAGKTVCAEYAVSLCRQHCTRAVYTSPIKALSNQKFRDFCVKFGPENVGLITGDMQLNVDNSTVLIMTTEILRSMLYRGADMIRDIEWVIFDEVHYINDSERGVVWEEVIIMLPPYVNLIFLSATTPNTIEFSDWIGRTKRKPVHVIRTYYRPVPLSHFLWAGLKLHKVMEGKGGFLDKGFSDAANALLPASAATKGAGNKGKATGAKPSTGSKQLAWQTQGNKQNWTSLIRYLDREGLTPTVVFSFSKKKCEEIAQMLRTLDLNTANERSAVHSFTAQTVARLSPGDSTLPQVLIVCEMVKRGIGVHHGGLLPILKEMVEILFSRNLIKVLFATETFAMGVNMPARAVVFNSIRKHDGTQFRVLEPGEYTQMAGRAGRRGLDKVGTVILCCFGETPPPISILRNMLTGLSTKLSSQFRLTFNMILNLLRVEDMSVEGMIKRSFSEFATQRALTANEYPKLLARGEKTLLKLEEQFRQDRSSRIGAEDLEDYFSFCSDLLTLNSELLTHILLSVGGTGGGVLTPGRMLLVTAARKHGYVRAPAVVLRPPVVPGSNLGRPGDGSISKPAICMVLLPESFVPSDGKDESKANESAKPGTLNYVGSSKHRHYALHEVQLDEILLISSLRHKLDVEKILKEEQKTLTSVGGGMSSRLDAFSNAVPVTRKGTHDFDAFMGVRPAGKQGIYADPLMKGPSLGSAEEQIIEKVVGLLIETEIEEGSSSLGIMDLRDCVKQGSDVLDFRQHCTYMEELVVRMRSCQSHKHPNIESHYTVLERKETLRERVKSLRHLLSNESLQLFPDFLQRKSVLRTLGYVDDNEAVCVKGRVACEVNTCEELIVTEMVFEGVMNDLEPAEIVAALSALVYQEKSSDEDFDAELPEQLISCCERMKAIAHNLGQLQKDHGLEVDPGEYCDSSLKFGLVHVVYEWALGVPFSNICELTLVQEGSIVRCITRLDELCREVRNCARVVGNPTLYRKMEAASMAIKRDIVFASSLYVS